MSNTAEKVYVAFKPCNKPVLHCQFNERGPWNDMSEHGVGYYEDEIGYYYMYGELVCDAE